jgi:predicted nucleotidyltransferase
MRFRPLTLEEFVQAVTAALPGTLHSVVLFGSAAAGDFVEAASRYDLLIVAERFGFSELEALRDPFRQWTRAGHPTPLLLTIEEVQRSTDAFAIEWLDMLQARQVLAGSDPLVGMTIDPTHLRLHLERELKGKLLALREEYVLVQGRRQQTTELMIHSLSTFLVLCRAALRLYQAEVPAAKLEALRALAGHISLDPKPFLVVEELKEGKRRLDPAATQRLFQDYLSAVEAVVAAVDRRLHPPAETSTAG